MTGLCFYCSEISLITNLISQHRAYAIQRGHTINFRWTEQFDKLLSDDLIYSYAHGILRGVIVYNEKDAVAMMGLSILMDLFTVINEDNIDCFNNICEASRGGRCSKSNEQTLLLVHAKLARLNDT